LTRCGLDRFMARRPLCARAGPGCRRRGRGGRAGGAPACLPTFFHPQAVDCVFAGQWRFVDPLAELSPALSPGCPHLGRRSAQVIHSLSTAGLCRAPGAFGKLSHRSARSGGRPVREGVEMSIAEPPVYDTSFERTPPHNIEAEQSVLGGMLLSKDAIADVIEVLRAEDFYRPAHQIIYDAIVD